MSNRILNEEQQGELRTNNNVQYCSERSITYTVAFKIKAVQQYDEGLTSREVFKQGGFNINLIGRDTPKECLHRWRKIIKNKGIKGLSESRGRNSSGRPKKQRLSETERLKYLEAEVKYLKAENAFLAQLQAKRAE